ncbi:hypothetical protein PG1C_11070 [Rugosibacter aromaticivorans]|uniref:Polysaccharide pyruvyl transferase domain-containing protein n=1 Tax=Rugosibacter aromaticivorans TaxID=1565605 RepID=A0A0C5J141_9PROT|nr:polysaccharide pyruvyl transferase family protein [Rugosibacter aromaticivorans]AJP48822.1 hypothetical protein PG1C_11070 [Rugosibacter aromaticivorans]
MNLIRVLLYVPVPETQAFLPVKRGVFQEAKSFLKRHWEIEKSVRSGKLCLSDYHHIRTLSSNRGDIAIGTAVKESLVRAFREDGCEITVAGWDSLSPTSVSWINDEFDLFVIGGGGYIFLDSGGFLNHRKKDIEFLKDITVPIVAYGIGLNRLMYEKTIDVDAFTTLPTETKNYLNYFSNVVSEISVRDLPTQQLFQRAAKRDSVLTGDPALFLGLDETPSSLSIRSGESNGEVGINVAAHGWRALKILEQVMPVLEPIFFELESKSAKELSYFLHDNLEYPVVEYLRRRGLHLRLVDGLPKVLSEGYRSMDFVVSQMLHSSILAFSVGTPAINIAYDLKSAAFFELFNLSEYSIPWNQLNHERLRYSMDRMRCSLQEVKATIAERRTDLLAEQERFLSRVISLVGQD